MKRLEQALHIQVANYLDLALKPPAFWTTFPAGGGGKMRGALLKRSGLKAGWPDIQVFYPSPYEGFTRVVGIELKTASGRQTETQREVGKAFEDFGGVYLICRSVEDVEVLLGAAGFPLHAYSRGLSINRR